VCTGLNTEKQFYFPVSVNQVYEVVLEELGGF
jgi:hypothetical protein